MILEGSSSVCVLQDIFNALERIGLGLEKKDAVMSEKKRKLVAYHEAGALAGVCPYSISLSMVHPDHNSEAKIAKRDTHAHAQILYTLHSYRGEKHAYQDLTFAFDGG